MTTPYGRAVDIGENHRMILLSPILNDRRSMSVGMVGCELAETAAQNEQGIKATAHGVPRRIGHVMRRGWRFMPGPAERANHRIPQA